MERPISGSIPDLLVDLDLLQTDAFLVYASHRSTGAVNPVTIDPEWLVELSESDAVSALKEALRTGAIAASLRALDPPQPEYARLRASLARYRALEAANLGKLPGGPPIKPEERSDQIQVLRVRVAAALDVGEAPAPEGDDKLYDGSLVEAVKTFQKRWGLVEDGVVGGATRESLNRDPEELARQIEVNMERWRWLPRDLGERHALVNIASFNLEVKEKQETVLSMRVVVGRPYRRTPVFSSRITHIVLNPSWTVPETIVRGEVLPAVRKSISYLETHHMRVFDGWSEGAHDLDPATIALGLGESTTLPLPPGPRSLERARSREIPAARFQRHLPPRHTRALSIRERLPELQPRMHSTPETAGAHEVSRLEGATLAASGGREDPRERRRDDAAALQSFARPCPLLDGLGRRVGSGELPPGYLPAGRTRLEGSTKAHCPLTR